jgi:hypothetical protein
MDALVAGCLDRFAILIDGSQWVSRERRNLDGYSAHEVIRKAGLENKDWPMIFSQ